MIRWLFRPIFDYLDRRAADEARQRELERLERREQLEMVQMMVDRMSTIVERSFEVSKSQNDVFKTWMDGFRTAGPPELRPYDEEEEAYRVLREKRGGDTPPELASLDRAGQFEALINKLNTFGMD